MIDPKCPECGALLKKKHLNENKCWKCKTENISELINSQLECSECGALNLPSKSFCGKCHKPLYGIYSDTYDHNSKEKAIMQIESNICIDCNLENSKDARFCKSCGKKLFKEKEITIIKCKKCGKEYDDTFQFCDIDGEKLEPLTKVVDESEYKKELKGLGGWLILVGFTLFGSAVGLVGILFLNFYTEDIISALFNITLLILIIVLITNYLNKREQFPRYFIMVSIIEVILMCGFYISLDKNYDDPLLIRFQLRMFANSIVRCIIWIPYMMKSKRVKNTFIN